MRLKSNFSKKTQAIAFSILASALAFTGFALTSDVLAARSEEVAKITEEQAAEIGLKEIPGEVTSVAIERKLKKNVYVVEILEKDSGEEVDVLVDIESGEVLGTER